MKILKISGAFSSVVRLNNSIGAFWAAKIKVSQGKSIETRLYIPVRNIIIDYQFNMVVFTKGISFLNIHKVWSFFSPNLNIIFNLHLKKIYH